VCLLAELTSAFWFKTSSWCSLCSLGANMMCFSEVCHVSVVVLRHVVVRYQCDSRPKSNGTASGPLTSLAPTKSSIRMILFEAAYESSWDDIATSRNACKQRGCVEKSTDAAGIHVIDPRCARSPLCDTSSGSAWRTLRLPTR
jgi:hypothetical protein